MAEGEGLGRILQRAVFTFEIPSGGRGGLHPPRRLGYFGLGIQGPGVWGGIDDTARASGAVRLMAAWHRTPCDEDADSRNREKLTETRRRS